MARAGRIRDQRGVDGGGTRPGSPTRRRRHLRAPYTPSPPTPRTGPLGQQRLLKRGTSQRWLPTAMARPSRDRRRQLIPDAPATDYGHGDGCVRQPAIRRPPVRSATMRAIRYSCSPLVRLVLSAGRGRQSARSRCSGRRSRAQAPSKIATRDSAAAWRPATKGA